MTVALRTKRLGTETSGRLRRFYFFPALLFVLILPSLTVISCASVQLQDATERNSWEQICPGADYTSVTVEKSDDRTALRYHVVRIDLTAPTLRLLVNPHRKEAAVSCNTTPFRGGFFQKKQPLGIMQVQGKELSPPNARYDALVLQKTDSGYRARIAHGQQLERTDNDTYAFGGYWQILKDGDVIRSFAQNRDARTACGISKDEKMLYLLVVEGNFLLGHRHERGLTYSECAELLLEYGAYNALEFDGGSSSQLFIRGKNMLSYPALVHTPATLGFAF